MECRARILCIAIPAVAPACWRHDMDEVLNENNETEVEMLSVNAHLFIYLKTPAVIRSLDYQLLAVDIA